jgi:uncharacterized membrane protein HdeD (DUF308 family)
MTSPPSCLPQLSMLHSIILLGNKVTPQVFSLTASTNKCPQNDTKRDARKSVLFVVVGVLIILLGLVFFLDTELNLHDIYAIILFAIGVVVLLGGIYGVCFLYNIRFRRH